MSVFNPHSNTKISKNIKALAFPFFFYIPISTQVMTNFYFQLNIHLVSFETHQSLSLYNMYNEPKS